MQAEAGQGCCLEVTLSKKLEAKRLGMGVDKRQAGRTGDGGRGNSKGLGMALTYRRMGPVRCAFPWAPYGRGSDKAGSRTLNPRLPGNLTGQHCKGGTAGREDARSR